MIAGIFFSILIILFLGFYFLPTIYAYKMKIKYWPLIFIFNIFGAWTGIIWVAIFIFASSLPKEVEK